MPATLGRIFAATALASCALASSWAPAAVAADPIGGGRTTLKLSAPLSKRLRENDVRLAKLKPGKAQGRTVTLPVAAGTLDRGEATAVVEHEGGFELKTGRRVARVRNLRLDTAARVLRGRIGGRKLVIASLRGLETERKGFTVGASVARLKLTANAAAAVNRALGVEGFFKAGRSLGALSTVALPDVVSTTTGAFTLGGEGTTLAKLESNGIAIGLWGTSTRYGETGPFFGFEIAEGAMALDVFSGFFNGESGLTMINETQPSPDLLLSTPRMDLDSRTLTAGFSAISGASPTSGVIATLDTDAAKARVNPSIDIMELTGVRAISTQFLADTLNGTFATSIYTAGETLGSMNVVIYAF